MRTTFLISKSKYSLRATALLSVLILVPMGARTQTIPEQTNCVPAPTGLVGWWQAEDNAADSAGGNPGSIGGSLRFVPGEVGLGFEFDGTTSAITVPSSPNLSVQSLTIEAWIFPYDVNHPRPIVEYAAATGPSSLGLWYGLTAQTGGATGAPGALYAALRDPGGAALQVGTSMGIILSNHWTHVALTFDSATRVASLYVNGALSASANSSVPIQPMTAVPVNIGYRPNGSSELLGGARHLGGLDEVSVYNRALSPAEVQAVYSAEEHGKCPNLIGPAILAQPQSLTVISGGSAEFAVLATGAPPLNYQWLLNGAALPGKTLPSLTLTNVQLGDSGNYSVIVTNAVGSVASSNAVLTVLPPPSGCTPASAGIAGWWQGEGNANDSIGTNNGVFLNGATFATGEVGQGFHFDGITNSVRVAASPSLNIGQSAGLTLEAWVNPSDTGNGHPVIEWSRDVAGSPYGVHLWVGHPSRPPGYFYANIADTTGNWHVIDSAPGLLQSNVFQHIAVTYDKTSGIARLYLNGSVVNEINLGTFTPQTSYNLYFGKRPAGDVNSRLFAGVVDEISIYGRALGSNELQSVYFAGAAGKCVPVPPSGCVPTPTNLVGWWRAEGKANDSAGTNDGLLVNGTSFVAGEVGQAFRFDGISNAVRIPASASLDLGQGKGFTLEAWVNPANNNSGPIFEWSRSVAGPPFGVHFWLGHPNAGAGYFYANIADTAGGWHVIGSDPGLIQTNTFQHIAVTYDKANGLARLFLNGVIVKELSLGTFTPQTSYDLYLGERPPGDLNSGFYAGLLDEASVYSRALSPSELQAIYSAGTSGKCTTGNAPTILSQPSNQTATVGTTVFFTVNATGAPPLNYQWQFNGTNLPGRTGVSLVLTDVQLSDSGKYSVLVSNPAGSVLSAAAALTVRSATSPLLLDIDFGAGLVPSPKHGAAALGQTNDFWNFYTRDDGHGNWLTFGALTNLLLSDETASQAGLTVANAPGAWGNGSTDPMYQSYIYPFNGGNVDILITNLPAGNYDILPYSADANFEISVEGTSYGVKHSYDNPVTNPPAWTEGVQYVRFSNVQVGLGQRLALTVRPGVYGYATLSGLQLASATGISAPPVILTQPLSQNVLVGDNVTLFVRALGAAPLTYQWQFNGSNIVGATTSTFTVQNVQLAQAGSYAVSVANPVGSILSSTSTLGVSPMPSSLLIDVDFGQGAGPTSKTGFAALGQATNDFWNFYTRDDGHGGWLSFGTMSNLALVNGTSTQAGMTVANAPGDWGNGSTDPMYNSYIYPFNGGNITIAITNLPSGTYNVLPYSADGDFELSVGNLSYGIRHSYDSPLTNPPAWMEGVQYARFSNINVLPGQPVVLTVRPGVFSYATISGLQLEKTVVAPTISSIDVDFGAGAGPSPKSGAAGLGQTNDFWNFYTRDDSHGNWLTFGALTNLLRTDLTPTQAGLMVSNAPGAWGNGSTDPMYQSYIYPFNGGNVVILVTNLPIGSYEILPYSSDGNFEVTVEGTSYGVKHTYENPVTNPPAWTEGVQYAHFRNVQVGAGQTVAMTVRPGVYGYATVSGIQLFQTGEVVLKAPSVTTSTIQNQPVDIPVQMVLSLASPAGTPLALNSVSVNSTNGGFVSLKQNTLVYTPAANFVGTDGFTYSIANGAGDTVSGSVSVQVRPANLLVGSLAPPVAVTGGIQVGFAGIPGQMYTVQRARVPNGPWTKVGTITVGGGGFGGFLDNAPLSGTAFYRTSYP